MAVQHKIDVNTATEEDLMMIPGLSEKAAQSIIDFRDSQGRIDDIKELAGAEEIDARDISLLREWLTAGPGGEEEEEEEESEEEKVEEGEEGEEEEEW